jgi:glycosyltransferase involved in cell wall biosynthesis
MGIPPASNDIELSIIVPMRNEIANARRCVENIQNCLNFVLGSYEIIIAEDGSTDGTREFVEQVARNNSFIRYTSSEVRLGKGLALTNAIKLSRGKSVAIIDADMTDDLDNLRDLIVNGKDADGLLVGSRVLGGVDRSRPVVRRITSKIYNMTVRTLFGDDIRDHQCGFKALSRDLVNAVIPLIREKGFAWDTEVIALTKRLGYPVREIPVRAIEKRIGLRSNIDVVKDGFQMARSLLSIRDRVMRVPDGTDRRFGITGSFVARPLSVPSGPDILSSRGAGFLWRIV